MIQKQQLVGAWKADYNPFDPQEELFLQFDEDNKLSQTSKKDGKQDIIFLTFELQGDELVTNQPSMPKIEKTKISFVNEKLALNYNGVTTTFTKYAGMSNGANANIPH